MSRGSLTSALAQFRPDESGRRWLFVAYDQLTDAVGPLAREAPDDLGVVCVECPDKAGRRPYHKQKLALILANQRHFALEQAERGVAVRYVVSPGSYGDALAPLARELGPLDAMTPAERELRDDLAPLAADGLLRFLPHEGWLTTTEQFRESAGSEPPWRMDSFYRHVRRATGVLMEEGKPEGGKFSFDADNRKPWPGRPEAPEPPRFEADPIKREVTALVAERYSGHPGQVDLESLPATAADAESLWAWALAECLPHFGPYEDAMSRRSRSLFHTRTSALLNLHRILPARVVRDVEALDAPLACREGFIRQVLGWREFVRHVHEATDGFAALARDGPHLGSSEPLPPAYWGRSSGLACLDTVVGEVWDSAYTHHIPRLMVLANLATLLDVSPRELTDWFWVAFVDAFDWVVEPNVLGMGTFAAGDLMTTKPYVSGAAYIDRMSDYCGECAFDPKRNCPITRLYWAFLDRHADKLADNPRLRLPLASLRRRSHARRAEDRKVFETVRSRLAAGRELRPD